MTPSTHHSDRGWLGIVPREHRREVSLLITTYFVALFAESLLAELVKKHQFGLAWGPFRFADLLVKGTPLRAPYDHITQTQSVLLMIGAALVPIIIMLLTTKNTRDAIRRSPKKNSDSSFDADELTIKDGALHGAANGKLLDYNDLEKAGDIAIDYDAHRTVFGSIEDNHGRIHSVATAYERPSDPQGLHALGFGKSGSGKTSTTMASLALHDGPIAHVDTQPAVFEAIYDARSLLGEVIYYSPGDPDTAGWDPTKGADDPDECILIANRIMRGTPPKLDHAANEHYAESGVDILAALLHAAALDPHPTQPAIARVSTWFSTSNVSEALRILSIYSNPGSTKHIRRLEHAQTGLDAKHVQTTNEMNEYAKRLRAFRTPTYAAAFRDNGLDPRQIALRMLQGEKLSLFIVSSAADAEDLRRPLTLLISEITATILKHGTVDANPNILIWIDEAPTTALPPNIDDLFVGNFRKFGCRLTLLAQSISQYRALIGDDRTDTLIENAGSILQFGPVINKRDREWWSDLVGTRDILIKNKDAEDDRPSVTTRPIIPPSTLGTSFAGKVLYLRPGTGVAIVDQQNYFDDDAFMDWLDQLAEARTQNTASA